MMIAGNGPIRRRADRKRAGDLPLIIVRPSGRKTLGFSLGSSHSFITLWGEMPLLNIRRSMSIWRPSWVMVRNPPTEMQSRG